MTLVALGERISASSRAPAEMQVRFVLAGHVHVCGVEPVQRRDAVQGFEAAARRHHVEAVAAVTGHVQVMSRVPVFHHDDKPRPSMRQVVAGHPLSTLRGPSIQLNNGKINTYSQGPWTGFVGAFIHEFGL